MKRGFFAQLQRDAYKVSRAAGDVDAAKRGVLAKRLARRALTRELFRSLRKL